MVKEYNLYMYEIAKEQIKKKKKTRQLHVSNGTE